MNRSLFLRYIRHAREVYARNPDRARSAFDGFAQQYMVALPPETTHEQRLAEQAWVDTVFAQEFPLLQG